MGRQLYFILLYEPKVENHWFKLFDIYNFVQIQSNHTFIFFQLRLTRIAIVIVGIFITCHLPRFIPNVVEMFMKNLPEVSYRIVPNLTFLIGKIISQLNHNFVLAAGLNSFCLSVFLYLSHMRTHTHTHFQKIARF